MIAIRCGGCGKPIRVVTLEGTKLQLDASPAKDGSYFISPSWQGVWVHAGGEFADSARSNQLPRYQVHKCRHNH